MSCDFYADSVDPLLSCLDFRITRLHEHFTTKFNSNDLFYEGKYTYNIYCAAFFLLHGCVSAAASLHILGQDVKASSKLARVTWRDARLQPLDNFFKPP